MFTSSLLRSVLTSSVLLLTATVVDASHGRSGGHGHSGGHHHGGSSHHHHGGGSFYGGFYRGGFYGGYGSPGYYGSWGYGGYPYGYSSGFGLRIYSTPRYYYSTPTYVYPNNSPTYAYPNTVVVDPNVGQPTRTFDNGPIVISSPATNSEPVEYSLNGFRFTIKPGQSQRFTHDRDWIVDFDRGGGQGAQYSLKSATYKFKKTDRGWELFEQSEPVRRSGEQPPPPPPVDEVIPKEVPKAPLPADANAAPSENEQVIPTRKPTNPESGSTAPVAGPKLPN